MANQGIYGTFWLLPLPLLGLGYGGGEVLKKMGRTIYLPLELLLQWKRKKNMEAIS